MKPADHWNIVSPAAAVSLILIGRGFAQNPDTPEIRIKVNEARPVLEVLNQLEKQYGWQMSYEDPPYESARDIVDITHPDFAREHPGRHQIMVRGKPFEFVFGSPRAEVAPDRDKVLEELLHQHMAAGNPGIFGISHTGSIAHIEPIKLIKQNGETVGVHSILDTPITFPMAQRSTFETLGLLLLALERQGGVNIGYLSWGDSLLKSATSQEGPNQEPARTVLVRILGDVDKFARTMYATRHLVWHLNYEADQKMYYFSLHTVTEPSNR